MYLTSLALSQTRELFSRADNESAHKSAYPVLGHAQPPARALFADRAVKLVQARHGLYLVHAGDGGDGIDADLMDYGEFDEEEAEVFASVVPRDRQCWRCLPTSARSRRSSRGW